MDNNRGTWKSSFGFILAAAGSAVGVGNLWRFPYMMGSNGGFPFLVVYLIIVVLLGMPVMLGEFAIGRSTQQSPVAAYSKIQKGSGFVGILAILAPFLIMTYYGIVGGWALRYFFSFLTTGEGTDFIGLITGGLGLGVWQPVLWNLVFMVIVWAVCIFGVHGIEKANKFMMPALLVLLIVVIIRSVTLPGAGGGFRFMFANPSAFTFGAIPAALGQAFFSLSLAMGAMITYGSYLKKNEDLPKNTLIVSGLDTGIALLAGFAIFPAVFAMGGEPGAGAGLAFITLPGVFAAMPLGALVGAAFFLLLAFAALTSAISLVEACSAFTIDTWKWNRKISVTLLCVLFCVLAIPNSLSMAGGNPFSGENFLGTGMNLFDAVDFFANNILLPLGGLLMCVVVGWFWKPESAVAEIEGTPGYSFKLKKAWSLLIKFVTPILILIVLVFQFIG
ncbi:MAG: sodium-dependent transporter [Oscillospiraceae bacterium]|nr:sodium-dependent transporter [Oscillospiraceae bacterium]